MNIENDKYRLINVEIANTPYRRLKGLMFRKDIEEVYALIIVPCNSIHTFFMQFPIDALFLDKNKRVLCIYEEIGKGEIIKPVKKCHYVVEMKAQNIRTKIKVGQQIEW